MNSGVVVDGVAWCMAEVFWCLDQLVRTDDNIASSHCERWVMFVGGRLVSKAAVAVQWRIHGRVRFGVLKGYGVK